MSVLVRVGRDMRVGVESRYIRVNAKLGSDEPLMQHPVEGLDC